MFDDRYRHDDTGRPACDPALLLKIVLYAYSRGITSSRQMIQPCARSSTSALIISPDNDGLVPAWSVRRFAEYAQQGDVDVELVRMPFANHVYNQIAGNSLGNQARRSITARYLAECGLAPAGEP